MLQAAPFNGIIVLNVVYSAGGFMQNIKSEYYVVNEQEILISETVGDMKQA